MCVSTEKAIAISYLLLKLKHTIVILISLKYLKVSEINFINSVHFIYSCITFFHTLFNLLTFTPKKLCINNSFYLYYITYFFICAFKMSILMHCVNFFNSKHIRIKSFFIWTVVRNIIDYYVPWFESKKYFS